MLGFNQLIDFPTRGSNTLDLMMTPHKGTAVPSPGAGTSDHISINITLEIQATLPPIPKHKPTRLWQYAPWSHIKGEVKRKTRDWDPHALESTDNAEADLDNILLKIIDRHVKWSKPKDRGPIVWWNDQCEKAYKIKQGLFSRRSIKPVRYNAAVNFCRTVQNRAFAQYQKDLSTQLKSMDKSDKSFWQLARDIGGIESSKSSAAPSAEDLAVHFANKMSNGKDEEDFDFVPKDTTSIPLCNFKIRHKRVKQVLKKIDVSKSANGISPRFWKETADVLSWPVTKLYRRIIHDASYVSRWKIARVTPPHKRGSVLDVKNYRPLSVLNNLSVYLEDVIDPQLNTWACNFIPDNQFGFVKSTGTGDYGAALACTIQQHLDNRGEGILVSLDVDGAFDKVWWARLKSRLKAKGMRRDALKLLHSYLKNRFLQVVLNGDINISKVKEIFSSVPQGGKWSPILWDLDISEMEYFLSLLAQLFCYADDCGIWYAITDENRDSIVQTINADLESLLVWGANNKTAFAPSKTHFTLISNKTTKKFDLCFPFPRLVFGGVPVKRKPAVKLVGFMFDEKMSWAGMIAGIAKKARQRLGMLTRLRPLLDDRNMETMYTTFIRPILEYGSIQFMGASVTHLHKLDTVQRTAERIGRFQVESLQSRREAAAISLTFKLLDGRG